MCLSAISYPFLHHGMESSQKLDVLHNMYGLDKDGLGADRDVWRAKGKCFLLPPNKPSTHQWDSSLAHQKCSPPS